MNGIRRAKNYYGTSQRKSSGAKDQSVSRELKSTAVGSFRDHALGKVEAWGIISATKPNSLILNPL
jgi:hypothetical protein